MRRSSSFFASFPFNLLRIGFLMVLSGFFIPVGCKATGFQIGEGILGNAKLAKNAILLSPVQDIYGYFLFGIFLFALIGLILTLLNTSRNGLLSGALCLAISFILAAVILIKFKIYFDFENFAFYIKIGFPIKLTVLAGGYLMLIGYICGAAGFILGIFKR